jgi:hypothetical protein
MLIPVIVAALGPRLRLNTAGAGIGALVGGMMTNIIWNLTVSPGGAAVFIGLAGSVTGLLLGHALSLWTRGKQTAGPALNEILALSENSTGGAFHAAFLNATNSVLVAAMRWAFSSR